MRYKLCTFCENRARDTPLWGVYISHFGQIWVKISILGVLHPYRCTGGGEIWHAKFHLHRCNVLPLRCEKPQNRPLSKLNTGRFALRAMLPVMKLLCSNVTTGTWLASSSTECRSRQGDALLGQSSSARTRHISVDKVPCIHDRRSSRQLLSHLCWGDGLCTWAAHGNTPDRTRDQKDVVSKRQLWWEWVSPTRMSIGHAWVAENWELLLYVATCDAVGSQPVSSCSLVVCCKQHFHLPFILLHILCRIN